MEKPCLCGKQPPQELPERSREILQIAGLYEVLVNIREAGGSISRGHSSLRRIERASALRISISNTDQEYVEAEMALARRHATAALMSVRKSRERPEWHELSTWLREHIDEARSSIREARVFFLRSLAESELPAEEAAEGLHIWDSTAETLQSGDLSRLYDMLEERCVSLDKVLRQAEDWGRKPHSPLETWQWIVIAAIVAIAVGVVIYCLWCCGCAFLYHIFVAACWGTGLIGGWAGVCAGFGF